MSRSHGIFAVVMTFTHRLLGVGLALALLGAGVEACVGDSAPNETIVPDAGGTDTGVTTSSTDGSVFDTGASDAGIDSAGQCDAGQAFCPSSSSCIDITNDPENCGGCMHSCGAGGTCTASVCQPQLLDGNPDGGGATITALTSDALEDNPTGPATHVFWSASGTSGAGIFQDNVGGGNMIQLGSLSTKSLAVHGNVVYSIGTNAGGPPQPLYYATVGTASSSTSLGVFNCQGLTAITYDVGDSLLVGTYVPTTGQYGFFKCTTTPTATCTTEGTFNGTAGPNIANNGTSFFIADSDDNVIVATTLPGNDSSSTPLMSGGPTLVRVNGSYLYWFDSATNTLQRSNLGVTSPKQIASSVNADAIAADATYIYWTDSTTGTLNFAPQAGTGSTTAYVTMGASSGPMKMVRDTQFLYFVHNTAIYRVALP